MPVVHEPRTILEETSRTHAAPVLRVYWRSGALRKRPMLAETGLCLAATAVALRGPVYKRRCAHRGKRGEPTETDAF